MGDEVLELDAYEFLSMVEREVERERRKEVRMLEKEDEMDWKRVVCILTDLRVVADGRIRRSSRRIACGRGGGGGRCKNVSREGARCITKAQPCK